MGPQFLLLDGATRLSLRREFGGVRAFASTLPARNLIVVAPSSVALPELVTDAVDAPPFGYDERGP